MKNRIVLSILIVMSVVCLVMQQADSAVHKLSEYKKLYATFYILPEDIKYLNNKPTDFILTGDIESQFKRNHKEVKYLLETFRMLKSHLNSKGFILVDSPEQADAILGYRIQLAGYDVYHECARNASVRIIDPITRDTLMLVYTKGMNFLSLKRDVYDELKKLLLEIDKNIENSLWAYCWLKDNSRLLPDYTKIGTINAEKDGLSVRAAVLYTANLSRQQTGHNTKDLNIVPIKIFLKNNGVEDVVFLPLEAKITNGNTVMNNDHALTSYQAMKEIGRYDVMAEALINMALGGALGGLGLTDIEGWAPQNDEKETGVVWNKFDPITRIKPGEETEGVLFFSLEPPREKAVARTCPISLSSASLALSAKKDSGQDIKIPIELPNM